MKGGTSLKTGRNTEHMDGQTPLSNQTTQKTDLNQHLQRVMKLIKTREAACKDSNSPSLMDAPMEVI